MGMLHGIIGIILLTTGHRLFWLFVGCVGFAAGFQAAQLYFGFQTSWVVWTAALLLGMVGALVAVFFQTMAIVLGGFAAGSTIGSHLATLVGFVSIPVVPLLGGILGAILLYVFFDWALIVLSSVAGATLVAQALPWGPSSATVLYLILIAAGILFQVAWLRRQKSGKGVCP